jgi:hypothetical protein
MDTSFGGGDANGPAPEFKGKSRSISYCICSVEKMNGVDKIYQFIVYLFGEGKSEGLASRAVSVFDSLEGMHSGCPFG